MSKSLFNQKDFFFAYIIASSSYCSYYLFRQLTKDIKRYQMFKESFRKKPIEYINQTSSKGGLVVLNGFAKKIYERNNNLVDSEIIISKSNSWYIENFVVESTNNFESFLIQPNQNTKMFSLPRRYNNKENMRSIWNRLFKFKSEIINSGDQVYLIGKIITNKNDLVPYSENLSQIKPYMISEHSIVDLQNECLSIFPMIKTGTKLLIAGCLFYFGLVHFKNCIVDYYRRRKRRDGILCHKCNLEPCNILCEKCENLTNYCSICYLSLQSEINNKHISLDDIKCVHCNKVLNVVQKLIV